MVTSKKEKKSQSNARTVFFAVKLARDHAVSKIVVCSIALKIVRAVTSEQGWSIEVEILDLLSLAMSFC